MLSAGGEWVVLLVLRPDAGVGFKLTPMVDFRRRGEGRASNSTEGEAGAIWDRRGSVTEGGGSCRH